MCCKRTEIETELALEVLETSEPKLLTKHNLINKRTTEGETVRVTELEMLSCIETEGTALNLEVPEMQTKLFDKGHSYSHPCVKSTSKSKASFLGNW